VTPDTRTCTLSLAVEAASRANACLYFAPGSGAAQTRRASHVPLGSSRRGRATPLQAAGAKDEPREFVEPWRGATVSIHDEYIVHGRRGQQHGRAPPHLRGRVPHGGCTVRRERAVGFDHSHNTKVNWDTFNKWEK
jgi:hypothetical protein